MIPHDYKVDFAKRKGNTPFPCYYCKNNVANLTYVCDRHNIVKEFGQDEQEGYDPIPQTCMAGRHGPSAYADCKSMMPMGLPKDYKRWYPSELFGFFTREYAMEMITDINCNRYLSKPMLIARSHKGYKTREQRIKEFIEEGIIDVSYDVDCNECYSLTQYGQMIADAICIMMDEYLLAKEHGDIMSYDLPRMVFEFIREHSDCTEKQIYDYFDREYGFEETKIPLALDSLVLADYVEPLYNDDFTRIGYSTTQKGILRWRALYVEND